MVYWLAAQNSSKVANLTSQARRRRCPRTGSGLVLATVALVWRKLEQRKSSNSTERRKSCQTHRSTWMAMATSPIVTISWPSYSTKTKMVSSMRKSLQPQRRRLPKDTLTNSCLDSRQVLTNCRQTKISQDLYTRSDTSRRFPINLTMCVCCSAMVRN